MLDALLTQIGGNLVSHTVGRAEVVTIHLHLNGTHAAHTAAAFIHVDFLDQRDGIQLSTKLVSDFRRGTKTGLATLSFGADTQVVGNDMGAVVSHRGKGIVAIGLTKTEVTNLDFRNGHELFCQTLGKGSGNILSCSYGKFYIDGDTFGIRLGHHFGLQVGCKEQYG